jgi:hypothetical protein
MTFERASHRFWVIESSIVLGTREPNGTSGHQLSRRMRSEPDGIDINRVLFQDCMLFIAGKPGNVVGF